MTALGSKLGQNCRVQIKQTQRMPGFQQVARHRCAHVAQAYKCNFHDALLNED